MKTVLFVPGFRESYNSRDYTKVLRKIQEKGYKTKFIEIDWHSTKTVADWVAQLEKEYGQHDPANVILAGFSFGAVTAFIAAASRNPAGLWLFSMSGAFSEDWPAMEKGNIRIVGKKRIAGFLPYLFRNLVKKISCPTLLFIGEKEARLYPSLNNRVNEARKHIQDSRLIVVPKIGHDIADPKYISAVTENI
ncbi:MAG: hypothetical protein WD898_02330 [Candidatus Paceibacterota bacterium]